MKKIIAILLFSLFCLNTSFAGSIDTSKNINVIYYDYKVNIAAQLFHAFASENFDGINMFCEDSIDFAFIKKDSEIRSAITDCEAIDNLNSIFKNIKFNKFQVLGGRDKNTQYNFLTILYFGDETINILFTLNYHNSISKITIF